MEIKLTGADIAGGKLAELIAKLSKASSVDVGWNEEARYPANHRNGGDFVANVAVINEFGGNWSEGDNEVRQIPPRPFFRAMIARDKNNYSGMIYKSLQANDYDMSRSLQVVGTEIQKNLQKMIVGWTEPGNAPRTIARKKRDDPLVESRTMVGTVNRWVK
jgi:hypothetical protein